MDSRSKIRGIIYFFVRKRFLIPLLATIAQPTVVNANENNGKLLEYKKLIEEGYEILDELVLKEQKLKNPTYSKSRVKEFMEEFSVALEKCNEAVEMLSLIHI